MNVVLPLFGKMEDSGLIPGPDALETLLNEAYLPDEEEIEFDLVPMKRLDLVTEAQFPDHSMYILEKQLQSLKESLQRMRFYLGDIDDLLPSKNL